MRSLGVTPLLAHGVGGRTDLPVPTWMVGYGAAAVLIVSFAALAAFWRTPRLAAVGPGAVVAGGRPARFALLAARWVGLAAFLLVAAAALFGRDDSLDNLAPTAVYIAFWVGLTIVSALVGDVYAALDPFATITAGIGADDSRPYRAGFLPAAAGLGAFVWLELVYESGARPRVLGVALVVLTAGMAVCAYRWGRRAVAFVDPFGAWFGVLGTMAPLGAAAGEVRLRWPLVGLVRFVPPVGTVPLVMVALGSTAFDGFTRTEWWSDRANDLDGIAYHAFGTVGLLAGVGGVTALYLGAARLTESLTGGRAGDSKRLAGAFVHSLVPIAFAYSVAHYASLLLFEGQATTALVSDPFGQGWDLFGTAGNTIDYTIVSTSTISWIQVGTIVVGHVAGVVLAHDRALELFPPRLATRSQYPLLVVMVALTVGGLVLLLGG
ncbi:MAG TPA: hypothetical protein VFV35_08060 [Acidimicrobiales bacterium]|nr:hypothetical protein [Acidimicrobiales bacterium]